MIGEGAGHARPRGPRARAAPAARTILAELLGYGATADAFHITLPPPGGIGAVRAARRAIDEGRPRTRRHRPRQRPRHVHARRRQGRAAGDPRHPRRPCRRDVPITANKSMLGHTLGAAGAIEAAVTILALRDGCVPPTINLVDPDEAGRGSQPDAERRPAPRPADRALELVRLRRPEHRAHLPAVGRVTEPDEPAARAAAPTRSAADRATRTRRDPAREASLLGLIDRLAAILDAQRSRRARGRGRRHGAAAAQAVGARAAPASAAAAPRRAGPAGRGRARHVARGARHGRGRRRRPRASVKAPLTGLFYTAPAPGSAPYVRVGGEVAVGQVIGLIEAMKLFNEIKSDVAGPRRPDRRRERRARQGEADR